MSQEVVAAKDGDKMYQEYLDDMEGRGQRPRSSRDPSASRNGSAGQRPEYAPEDREGYPYLEGDIRQHPTIRGYLPCHPLQGDDRELKDAMLVGSASDAWFPPQPDRHRLSWPQTPQNAHVYGRTDEGGSKDLSNRWMLAAGVTDWVPGRFVPTKMEPLSTGLTPRVVRDPYLAGERKGPPQYSVGELKHYGLDHRKRFPYVHEQACDEKPEERDPAIVTAFNPLPFDQLEPPPWRAPTRGPPIIAGSNLESRGANYPHYGYSDQSCTGSDQSHRAHLKPNFYSYGKYDNPGSYSKSDVWEPYHPSSMHSPYVQHTAVGGGGSRFTAHSGGHRHGSYTPMGGASWGKA